MDPTTTAKQTTGPQDHAPPPPGLSSPQGQTSGDQSKLQRQVSTTLNTHAPQGAPQGPAPTAPPAPSQAETPVSKALDKFARADDTMIEAAASAHIMRTDKVEDKKLLGSETSENGVTVSGTHESAAQASIHGRAEVIELADAYVVLVNAGIILGASLKLEGELKAKYGKLEAKIGGKLAIFAGAYAKASGSLEVGSKGIVAEGSASAFAGVKGSGSASAEFTYGALGIEGEIEAEGSAGASAEAQGELSLTAGQIAISGEAKVFAGVEGTVTGTGKAKLYGRDAFTAKGSASASAGVGGEVGGGISIGRGKITISLKAKGTVGIGGGGDVELAADLKPVAVWAWRQFDKAKWSYFKKDEGKSLLDDPEKFRQPLRSKLDDYTHEKITKLHAGKADNFVKIEKVQQYVGEVMPRKQVKGHKNALTIDRVIKECIDGSLNAGTKRTNIAAVVKDGKIEKIDNLPEGDELAAEFKTRSKTGKAIDGITSGRG